nr:immunoglobulin-like and fibronectin type III domain-containing protein 1 [Salvelinus alpinus]
MSADWKDYECSYAEFGVKDFHVMLKKLSEKKKEREEEQAKGSPWPEVTWLKDDVPVLKRVSISNSESSSPLLITSSECSDSGIYTIGVKNLVGQESFSVEVRVTDDPKPPGPVELEENVPGTMTVIWEPSPDEKCDDHLRYSVSKQGSWSTVADRLFNNKFTTSVSTLRRTWAYLSHLRTFVVNMPAYKTCDLRTTPSFLLPLRQHTAPKVRVTPKDWGEYTIQIEGALGRAECSTKLSQR